MRHPALELDFLASHRRSPWPGALLLLFSLALAAVLAQSYRLTQQELISLRSDSLLAPARRDAPPPTRAQVEEQRRNAHAVTRQLALPWAPMLDALEQAATQDVALLLLQPDASRGLLRLTAESRHRDGMFEYLRRLGAAPALSGVHLVSHQVRVEDPQRPIQFSIQATLRTAP